MHKINKIIEGKNMSNAHTHSQKEDPFKKVRTQYQPTLPSSLIDIKNLTVEADPNKSSINKNNSTDSELKKIFPNILEQPFLQFTKKDTSQENSDTTSTSSSSSTPLKIGVVLSGGQAPGGHNVITGLFDALQKLNTKNTLYGFLEGPSGIIENNTKELTASLLEDYRNTGGFDLIGSGRTKIETPEQFKAAQTTVETLNLDGLVVIGGDDSNTNAALLAEYFLQNNCKTKVIGVPKTIDGDLKNDSIEISFGFDTACKTFSATIGNLLRDSLSAKKYFFFIKLMGRSASHIALECALQTHPNLTLIGEEEEFNKSTLKDVTNRICDVICQRAEQGKNYGAILFPEGLIEFIPEFKTLIQELNEILAKSQEQTQSNTQPQTTLTQDFINKITQKLSVNSINCFSSLPKIIQSQLLLDRDPHGNLQVSKIETERLFIEMANTELERRKQAGTFTGSFNPQPLFCGYEGRSCYPSNFDTNYCYSLGHVTCLLLNAGCSGYMSCIQELHKPVSEWKIKGIPLTTMMTIERRHGKLKPVIEKAMVDLNGAVFKEFKDNRDLWKVQDNYRYPSPIQLFGPESITNTTVVSLQLEKKSNLQYSN